MDNYNGILDYIEAYWDKATFYPGPVSLASPRNILMQLGRIKLPHAAVAPNHTYFAGSQYYWDSYFTILGLVDSGRLGLAKGMVDNLIFLFKRFGLVPARNTVLSTGRTQPPFLTSMILEVHGAGGADDDWLDNSMKIAASEYETVWTSGQRKHEESGLSLYRPRFLPGYLTTYESGWDVSSRFAGKGANAIPIDLNCMLYKYETDIYEWSRKRGNTEEAKKWKDRLNVRRQAINKYLWNEQHGFFYDYDLRSNSTDGLVTTAGLFALWCGVASRDQALACQKRLKVLEQKHGLATTEPLAWKGYQWDFPNAWAPLIYIAITGLRNYGLDETADRITNKWLGLQAEIFQQTGELWEKYDVANGSIGRPGRYPTQTGFSWTNGVFARLVSDVKRRGQP